MNCPSAMSNYLACPKGSLTGFLWTIEFGYPPRKDSCGSRHSAEFDTMHEARHSDDQHAPKRPLEGEAEVETTLHGSHFMGILLES